MDTAVTVAEFGRLLQPLLPADAKSLGVAVSGGADSLSLALLTAGWAKARKLRVTAFIVDHRLRPESSSEARQVAGWLKAAGIPVQVLVWTGAKPAANKQAAARAARYALLQAACARAGIRHLLLAQHRDDQAETLLLRALRGSGADGLAAMAPQRLLEDGLMLLRPLLDIPKARLVATLQKRRQPWVEDPSNANPAYMRVRVRRALDLLSNNDTAARAELVAHVAQTARNFARTRAMLEEAAYDLLHRAVQLDPAGFAWLDRSVLASAHEEIALRSLGRLLCAIGGDPLPPRLDRLERLLRELGRRTIAPQTLHRCLLRPVKGETALLVCREARHLPEPMPLKAGGGSLLWDGRFRIALSKAVAGVTVAPLGRTRPEIPAVALPQPVLPALPALWKAGKLLAVPALGWGRMPKGLTVAFRPSLLPPVADAITEG